MATEPIFYGGHYSATVGGTTSGCIATAGTLGETRDGFRIYSTLLEAPINIDKWGDSEVEGLLMGHEVRLEFINMEFVPTTGTHRLFNVFSPAYGKFPGTLVKKNLAFDAVLTKDASYGNQPDNWIFYLVRHIGDGGLILSSKEPRNFTVMFKSYPDLTKTIAEAQDAFYNRT